MKTSTKTLLILFSVVLLVVASVMGTLAYLTDTESATNTFTVGKVDIKLDEAKVGEDGKAIEDADRVTENSYHLLPGGVYDKDPTVTVLKGSDTSYIRAIVTLTFDHELTAETLAMNLDTIFTGYNQTNWPRKSRVAKTVTEGSGDTEKKYTVITYEYRYKETVAAPTADVKLPALFTKVEIPGTWTNADMAAVGNFTIGVEAHAIQATGFDDADAAWAAFAAQNP